MTAGLDAYALNFKQQHVINENNFSNEILFGGAKGGGKAISLDTPLPTSSGWTTFGDVKVGDHVISEDGWPTRVIAISEVETAEDAYRLTFSDSTSIVVGERHSWKTMTAKDRAAALRRSDKWKEKRRLNRPSRATDCKGGKGTGKGRKAKPWLAERNRSNPPKGKPLPVGEIKSTKRIAETLHVKMGKGLLANHSIKNHAPLSLPPAELTIPPYTLGAWLGDGCKSTGQIAGIDDEVFLGVAKDGFVVTQSLKAFYSRNVRGLKASLRAARLYRNKHVPTVYLRASHEQRLALLHGLMDTDGWCEKDGSCKIALTNKVLFDGVAELIRTFGITVNVAHGFKTATNGSPGNLTECWTACFVTEIAAFRLRRKLERQNRSPHARYRRRFIVAAENIGPVPMRCIQVQNPSGMFLAGRQMIPTHNSFLIRYIFSLLCLHCPGFIAYLFRRTFDDLWKNHMEGPTGFPIMLAPYINDGLCAIVRSEVRWANGARIFLNHLQLQKHVNKYQGQEMHALGLDEATQFTEAQIRYLFGSVRLGEWGSRRLEILKNPDIPADIRKLIERLPLILMGANPGGVSHGFIKARFIDQGPFIIRKSKEKGEKAFKRQFIPARAEDNPNLLRNDPLYLDRLEAMGDAALVQAMREGDWNVVAGSMFGDVFRKTKGGEPWHVCEAFDIPTSWNLWRGADDGYAAPFAGYWLTRHPDTETFFVIEEIYRKGMSAPEVSEAVMGRDLEIELCDEFGNALYNNRTLDGKLDSAAFANTGAAQVSRGEQMNNMGCNWKPVEKFHGSRIARVQNFHKLLRPNPKENNRRPGIVFFSRCVNAIRTIPAILRDDRNPEDVSDDSELHAFDGVTYGLEYVKPWGGRVRLGGI